MIFDYFWLFGQRTTRNSLAQEKGGDFGDLVKNAIFVLTYPKKNFQNLQMWDFFCIFACKFAAEL